MVVCAAGINGDGEVTMADGPGGIAVDEPRQVFEAWAAGRAAIPEGLI